MHFSAISIEWGNEHFEQTVTNIRYNRDTGHSTSKQQQKVILVIPNEMKN